MDIISFNEASTANGRIESFIENPDSASGVLTVPKVIASGETITIPAGRVAVLPNVQVDGTLNVEGDVFIPSGATFGDLENQIALKAPLASPALTGTPTINGVNVSGYSGFKNYIINGGFNVNQYPSFSNTSDGYKFDRWGISAGTTFNTMSQIPLNSEASSNKALSFTKTSNLTSWIWTRIEFPRILAGKTVTLSFRAYSNTGHDMQAHVYFDKYNPTDGVTNATTGQTFTWNNSWSKRTMTFTLPTLGTNFNNDNSYFQLNFSMTGTTTGAYLTDVQLEEGSIATPFEQRPYGLELSLCQRYYEVGRCIQQLGIGTTIGVILTGQAFFKTSKRIVPTVTCLDLSGAQNKVTLLNNSGAETNGVSITAGNQTHNDMRLTASTTNTTQNGISFTYTASAEL